MALVAGLIHIRKREKVAPVRERVFQMVIALLFYYSSYNNCKMRATTEKTKTAVFFIVTQFLARTIEHFVFEPMHVVLKICFASNCLGMQATLSGRKRSCLQKKILYPRIEEVEVEVE